ncbi:hypothetical protein B0J17DRAFT_638975 [Rhizoctonia solani]|nr:hypothetical protein B0J17DRAFT_638975 [Rhizoctonia solani]
MSNLAPYNQHEYRPLQVAPPLGSNPFVQPLVQQPCPVAQQQLQIQPRSAQPSPQPNEYGQNASGPFTGMSYSPSPFDWIVPTITSLLQSQHATVLAKFNEASEQELTLASKVEALQRSTDALQQTFSTVLDNIQQVSDKVAKLGADMSSRDATLAERLNALDDAIEAWPADARLTGTPSAGELQAPPGSDEPDVRSQSAAQSIAPVPVIEQDQQLQPLHKVIQDAGSPGDSNSGIQPELDGNGTSSLSSISQTPPSLSTQENAKIPKTPGRRRKGTETLQTAPPTTRRSSRQSKKRQRKDGTMDIPVTKKRVKTVPKITPKSEPRVGGKAPRKSTLSQFDWQSVPIQDEELEQLIYCDNCDQAFHWGCVNISPEDPILQSDATWSCPLCEFEEQYGPIPGRTRDPDVKCRPDCPVQDHADDMFAIDAIIGRFPHSADPSGVMMQYLIKWEDYPVQRSTWTPEHEIGQAVHALIRDFEKAALNEKLDISDKSQLILLQEAREGGWGYYTFPS